MRNKPKKSSQTFQKGASLKKHLHSLNIEQVNNEECDQSSFKLYQATMVMEYIKRVLAKTKRASAAIVLAILCTATLLPGQAFSAQSLQQVESKPFENQLAKSYAKNFCISLNNGLSQENAFVVALRSSKPAYINPSQWLKLISEYTQPEHLEEKESIANLVATEVKEACDSISGFTGTEAEVLFASKFIAFLDTFS